ncbi:MAG: ATP-binding cassette domain-containing protein [Myxococcales bacterium]|nr:ATP-binding cassette domain-containing protein [Myxococcales bacterium]
MATRRNLLLPDVARWPRDEPVIVLENVTKAFGPKQVLKGLSLSVEAGKTTVIAGQSGSGKSVLLRMMNALTLPDSGTVRLFGCDLAKAGERERTELRKRCTMVFQNYALIDSLTVAENIGFPLAENTRMRRAEIRKLVAELLALLELSHAIDAMPASLSGGMKKRVSLARAVISNPEVVLFDEPTTGLDPVIKAVIDGLILELQEGLGSTALVITHDLDSAFRIADRIAFLYRGRIVANAPPQEFRDLPDPRVQQFIQGLATGPLTD